MARTVTPNQNDNILFDERIVDGDGDTLTVDSVELDQIDGITQSGGSRTPSWLNYSSSSSTLSSGATELIVSIEIDSTQISDNTTYTLELIVSDPQIGDTRYVDFTTRPQKGSPKHFFISNINEIRKVQADGSYNNENITFTDNPDQYLPMAATDNEGVVVGLTNRIERYDENFNKQWENLDPANDVQALTFGPDGFIYVGDKSGKLLKINRNGTTISTIRGTGGFGEPIKEYIIPIANGNVFLYEDNNRRLHLVDRFGNDIWTVDRDAEQAFGHQDQDRLGIVGNDGTYVYDRTGNLRWNSNYFNNRYSERPSNGDLNPYSNRLAALGRGGGEINLVIFDDAGNVLSDIGLDTFIGGLGSDAVPLALQWDEGDNIYAVIGEEFNGDYSGHAIKFDTDGNYLWDNRIYDFQNNTDCRIAVPRFLG